MISEEKEVMDRFRAAAEDGWLGSSSSTNEFQCSHSRTLPKASRRWHSRIPGSETRCAFSSSSGKTYKPKQIGDVPVFKRDIHHAVPMAGFGDVFDLGTYRRPRIDLNPRAGHIIGVCKAAFFDEGVPAKV